MDKASYFIKHKALFGSFPTQESVNELETLGVKYFVNLTNLHEKKITPYTTNYNYISFPIKDRKIPYVISNFSKFIVRLGDIIYNLQDKELIYIHCKGGHGRSGIVVACLLCYLFNMCPKEALEHTNIYHNNRKLMKNKWRKIGSPQTFQQKKFVYRLFKPISFYRAYKVGRTAGFSNFSNFPIIIDGIGTFPTAEAAINAYKDINNKSYVKKQLNSKSGLVSRKLSEKIPCPENWSEIYKNKLYEILILKYIQHSELKSVLLNTGLSPIINRRNPQKEIEKNILGILLVKLRTMYFREE